MKLANLQLNCAYKINGQNLLYTGMRGIGKSRVSVFKNMSGREVIMPGAKLARTRAEILEDKDVPLLGRKYDGEKLRWDLLPWEPTEEVVKVLTFGAKKYAPNNWKYVPGRRWRYIGAAYRHLKAWICGEKLDVETGLHHLAHAACCLLFLLWCDSHPDPTDSIDKV